MLIWWVMAAVEWSLLKTRYDLVFSNIVIKSPKQVAYKTLGFLKQWIKMAKEDVAKKEFPARWRMKMKEGLFLVFGLWFLRW
jgi:hypothetical protein